MAHLQNVYLELLAATPSSSSSNKAQYTLEQLETSERSRNHTHKLQCDRSKTNNTSFFSLSRLVPSFLKGGADDDGLAAAEQDKLLDKVK